MSNRFLARLLIVIVVVCLAPSAVAGQVAPSGANSFQTPWGDPDLHRSQGHDRSH